MNWKHIVYSAAFLFVIGMFCCPGHEIKIGVLAFFLSCLLMTVEGKFGNEWSEAHWFSLVILAVIMGALSCELKTSDKKDGEVEYYEHEYDD